ncbi:MAG: hypothetical protein GY847_09780 [Proteobacteria bacterium]|nr:hypothetical protein [Pseudomonadota bacterium]
MNYCKCLLLFGIVIGLVVPHRSNATSVGGHEYPARIEVGGESLKLVGAGIREFLFIDIYTMGVYSESGCCNPKKIVEKDEIKYIRLRMSRHIPARRLASNMKTTLNENLHKNSGKELKKKVEQFVTYLKKDCPKNSTLEIIYIPQKGTTLKQNGKILGRTIAGKDFSNVIFSSYFSGNTCCSGLKESILDSCKKH